MLDEVGVKRDIFSSRASDPETHERLVALLLQKLANLARESDPIGGDTTATGKDLRAFEALQAAGMLVRTLAGWAVDHQVGLALSGLSFVPLQPRGTKEHDEYQEKLDLVNRHGHEHSGAMARATKIEPAAARSALINLLLSNPGDIPASIQYAAVEALRALDFGETTPLVAPARDGRKAGYNELLLQLEAIGFVEYRVARGTKKYRAQEVVAAEYGVSSDTLRSWEKRLRQEFGRLEVARTTAFAQNAGSYADAAQRGEAELRFEPDGVPVWEKKYGEGALKEAAQRYRSRG